MLIQILVDNSDSWIIPYVKKLKQIIIKEFNYKTIIINDHHDVQKGDVLCLLSCEKLFQRLDLNKYNLVVHESDLPKGKGWSPLTWQVLEGKNEIPITLFEATDSIDSGKIYFQDTIKLNGYEIFDEIKKMQGQKTIDLIVHFLKNLQNVKGRKQIGKTTFYKKRGPNDSKLDINKTISQQFNLLRVCDNKKYPAFFIKDGVKFLLKIEKPNK